MLGLDKSRTAKSHGPTAIRYNAINRRFAEK